MLHVCCAPMVTLCSGSHDDCPEWCWRCAAAAGYKLVTEEAVSPLTCVHIGGEQLSIGAHRPAIHAPFLLHGPNSSLKYDHAVTHSDNNANVYLAERPASTGSSDQDAK